MKHTRLDHRTRFHSVYCVRDKLTPNARQAAYLVAQVGNGGPIPSTEGENHITIPYARYLIKRYARPLAQAGVHVASALQELKRHWFANACEQMRRGAWS